VTVRWYWVSHTAQHNDRRNLAQPCRRMISMDSLEQVKPVHADLHGQLGALVLPCGEPVGVGSGAVPLHPVR
jgi:hypothetical protein